MSINPKIEYALASFRQFHFSEDENIVYGNGAMAIIPSQFSIWLKELKKPFTPELYIQKKIGDFGLSDATKNDFFRVLEILGEKGILIPLPSSAAALVAPKGNAKGSNGLNVNIALQNPMGFATITSDRPECLSHCLESYLDNCTENNHFPSVTVVDNSKDIRFGKMNLATLVKSTKSRDLVGYFIGKSEKEKMAADLAEVSGAPGDIIKYALFGRGLSRFQAGANRNTLAIFSAGQRVVCVDDDTVCDIVRHPDTTNDQIMTAQFNFDLKRFRSRSEGKAFVADAPKTDFFGWHEQLLGKSVGGLSAVESNPIQVESLPEIRASYSYPNSFSVRTTWTGVFGDSGTSQPLVARDTNDQVLKDAKDLQDLEKFYYSREVLKFSKNCSITNASSMQTIAVGIDYSVFMPPFIPEFRHEDDINASIYGGLFRDRLQAFLPFAVTHNPPERREFSAGHCGKASDHYFFSTPFLAFVQSAMGGALNADPVLAITQLGNRLLNVSKLDNETFLGTLSELCLAGICQEIESIDNALAQSGSPEFWKTNLAEIVDGKRLFLKSSSLLNVKDFDANIEMVERVGIFKKVFEDFGNLLVYWPQIYSAAVSLAPRWRDEFAV